MTTLRADRRVDAGMLQVACHLDGPDVAVHGVPALPPTAGWRQVCVSFK
jgi:hypothetical protein